MGSATPGAFGLEPGEGRPAGLMALHSMAMGLATVFFETAASALFVSRFGAAALPWVYIAAAFVNAGAGALFAATRRRLAFRPLMASLLLGLLVGVAGLRLGLAATDAALLVFGLLVFHRVLSVLTDLEYWAVAGQLFDLRQAKRLYGLIGTGETVARIGGAFAVPLLVPILGVPNLLWISAGALLACLGLLLRILPGGAGPDRDRGSPDPSTRGTAAGQGVRALLGEPYLRLLFALAVLSVLAKHFVDFAFLAATRERSADAAAFASFFGLFSGLTQTLSLLTRLFASGPLLARFGIRTGLLVLPVAHTICTSALVAAAFLPGAGGAAFWLVLGNQGLYKVLKHPIDNPSFKVLYQPLARPDRLSAQVVVETMVTPLTTGLAGAVMLVAAGPSGAGTLGFPIVLLLTFLAWTGVASRAGRAYARALLRALRGRLVPAGALELQDRASLRALEAALASERPGDVVFALDLLARAAPARARPLLARLVEHPLPEVRRAAFEHLERRADPGTKELAAHRLMAEEVPEVRVAALSALVSASPGDEAAPLVSRFLADPDARVREAALAALVRGDPRADSPWRTELLRRAASATAADRLDVARAIGALAARDAFDDALGRLLADPVRDVRRQALVAAGWAGGPAVLPTVAAALRDRRDRGTALKALQGAGALAVPALEEALRAGAEPAVAVRLLRVLGTVGGERAMALLRAQARTPDLTVRRAALAGLVALGHRLPEEEHQEMTAELLAEAERAAAALGARRDLAGVEPLLDDALDREADAARERALLWLALAYEAGALARAREGLRHPERERRALALEVLDLTLSPADRAAAMPLCAEAGARLLRLEAVFPQPSQEPGDRLRPLVAGAQRAPLLGAAALYAVGRHRYEALRPEVDALAGRSLPPLVQETAVFARARLAGEKGSPASMLTIEKVMALKAARMFQKASAEVLAEVAAILETTEVPAGAAVFEKGAAGDSMYIIADGRMRVSDGERTVSELRAGDVFGELALLDPEPRLFTVAALEDSRLLRLDREAFLELMEGDIEIVRGVLHVLCERLRQAESALSAEAR